MAAVVDDWRPDLVMRETAEFSSYVVAESHGIPHVQVAMGLMAIEEFAYPLIDDALAALGAPSGTAGLRTAPVLNFVPECLEEAQSRAVPAVNRFRGWPASPARADLGDWWTDMGLPPDAARSVPLVEEIARR